MSEIPRHDDLPADVAWARDQLARANPVLTAAPPAVHGPEWRRVTAVSAAWVEPIRGRTRRRATVVSALVGVAALVGALVAAAVVTSPGSSHQAVVSGPPEKVLLAATATTEAAKSADMSFNVSFGGQSFAGQGAADLTTGLADFTADLPAPLGSVEILSTGTTAYVKVPSGFQMLTGGKPWVKSDSSTLGSLAGPRLGATGIFNGFDFTGVVEWLRGVSAPFTTVSTTDLVHGDRTTHYRATVDLAKVAANAPASVRARLGTVAAADQTLPVDVWIDAQGRLRRVHVAFDLSKVESGGGGRPLSGTVDSTVELWGFGTAIDVTPPAADQVSDLSGVLGNFKRGGPTG
jgi:hypothetical protein